MSEPDENSELPQLNKFLLPSPVPTRRSRTYSASERALQGPTLKGVVKSFCRQKGHGYVQPAGDAEPLFLHVSDIEGEYVPKEGDEVVFKKCPIPPKNEKFSAVHVKITHLVPGTHEKWDDALNYPKLDSGDHNKA